MPELRYDSSLDDDPSEGTGSSATPVPPAGQSPSPGRTPAEFASQPTRVEVDTGAETRAGPIPGVPGEAPDGDESLPSIDGYEILGELGRGGMAVVFKARQVSLDRIVAIKLMSPRLLGDPSFAARFEREALALASLQHPNVVAIHDRGSAGGRPYFVMEFVEGYSVRRLLQEAGGVLALEWVLHIMLQVADALGYVHGRATIHRDIKPENVLVTDDGLVKVSDFGLAGLLQREESGNLTVENSAMGTLHYMAPEQRLDARNVDQRADIYSFGIMLYELATGSLPIGAWRPPSQLVPGLPPQLDALVEACLQPDPGRRLPSIQRARADLLEVQQAAAAAAQAAHEPAHDPKAELEEAMARISEQAKEDEAKAAAARKKIPDKPAGKERDPELDKSASETGEEIRWSVILKFFGEWTEAIVISVLVGLFLLAGGFRSLFPDAPKDDPKVTAAAVAQAKKDADAKAAEEAAKAEAEAEAALAQEIEDLAEEPVEEVEDPIDELMSEPLDEPTTAEATLVATGVAALEPTTEAAQVMELSTEEARIQSLFPDPEDKSSVLRALSSTDPFEVIAAIRLEEAGLIRYSVKTLDKLLGQHADPLLQEEVVARLLERPEDPKAREALVRLIERGGAASGYALAALVKRGDPPRLDPGITRRFVVEAALVREPTRESMRAIRDLAGVDGREATEILKKLRVDRSPAIRRMATAAWEARVRFGLVEDKAAVPRGSLPKDGLPVTTGPARIDEDWGLELPPLEPVAPPPSSAPPRRLRALPRKQP